MPPDSPGKYFIGRIRGGDVARRRRRSPEGAPPMAMWNTYIWVDSADETAAKVRDAGGQVLMEPFDVMDAGPDGGLRRPRGRGVLRLAGRRSTRARRIVNEHGSLNFNGLNTRDLEGAKAFYGAVFGWETLDLGRRRAMWTLPGYGDYLEQRNPGHARAHGGDGRARGLRGRRRRAQPDPPTTSRDTPPHWGVTFARRRRRRERRARPPELGGQVIVAPFDAPWVRMTVIADPQGATFIASQFVPENRDVATA